MALCSFHSATAVAAPACASTVLVRYWKLCSCDIVHYCCALRESWMGVTDGKLGSRERHHALIGGREDVGWYYTHAAPKGIRRLFAKRTCSSMCFRLRRVEHLATVGSLKERRMIFSFGRLTEYHFLFISSSSHTQTGMYGRILRGLSYVYMNIGKV